MLTLLHLALLTSNSPSLLGYRTYKIHVSHLLTGHTIKQAGSFLLLSSVILRTHMWHLRNSY